MAKVKGNKGLPGAQSHLRARILYLSKAATYLQQKATCTPESNAAGAKKSMTKIASADAGGTPSPSKQGQQADSANTRALPLGLSRSYISQMRGVSLKSQLRLPADIKRSFCKRCDTLLVPGSTCVEGIQNTSHGHKKPWADVLVIHCSVCGTKKRFPQGQQRSKKLSERQRGKAQATEQQAENS
jgi:ribonuclease P protein subunit RPR2